MTQSVCQDYCLCLWPGVHGSVVAQSLCRISCPGVHVGSLDSLPSLLSRRASWRQPRQPPLCCLWQLKAKGTCSGNARCETRGKLLDLCGPTTCRRSTKSWRTGGSCGRPAMIQAPAFSRSINEEWDYDHTVKYRTFDQVHNITGTSRAIRRCLITAE